MDGEEVLSWRFIPLSNLPSANCSIPIPITPDFGDFYEILEATVEERCENFVRSPSWPQELRTRDWGVYLSEAGFYHPENPQRMLSDEIICLTCGLSILNLRHHPMIMINRFHLIKSPACLKAKRLSEQWFTACGVDIFDVVNHATRNAFVPRLCI